MHACMHQFCCKDSYSLAAPRASLAPKWWPLDPDLARIPPESAGIPEHLFPSPMETTVSGNWSPQLHAWIEWSQTCVGSGGFRMSSNNVRIMQHVVWPLLWVASKSAQRGRAREGGGWTGWIGQGKGCIKARPPTPYPSSWSWSAFSSLLRRAPAI